MINTNRLRVAVRPMNRGYSETFHVWRATTWKSRDHDKPRQETTCVIECLGVVMAVKWRPDGKADGSQP